MIIDTKLSNNEHIVRTTQQWEAAAVKYKIIPNGCLCVEFTPDGKTKIKIGDGHKYYSELPYIGGDIDINEIIKLIEEYVNSKEFLEIQEPILPSTDNLPITGNEVGDVRFVINPDSVGEYDKYIPYVWFDDRWNIVGGGNVDLSNYPTKEEMSEAIDVVDDKVDELSETVNTFDDRITNVEDKAHTHSNKTILDNTTASLTTQEETKLAGIEEHANNYSLPTATETRLGGIKVGENLTITSDGTLNASGGDPYELPPATTTDLGGVIVGDNLSITEQGVLSADAQQIDVDNHLDDTSENPVQNKVLTPVLESLSTMITKISKQKVDLWWGMDDAPYIDIGNALVYLDGIVEDIIPEIGIAEDVNE